MRKKVSIVYVTLLLKYTVRGLSLMDISVPHRSNWRMRGWALVCAIVAAVLLIAAVFKSFELGSGALPVTVPALLLIQVEWLVGCWLLSGWRPLWARAVAGLLFIGFAAYAAGSWWSGASSCGCFGRFETPPGATLVLDLVLLILLAVFYPVGRDVWSSRRWQIVIAGVLWFGLGASTVAAGVGNAKTVSAAEGPAVAFSLTHPRTWLGHDLSMLDQSDVKSELSHGVVYAMLYHHDCGRCLQRLQEWAAVVEPIPAPGLGIAPDSTRIAVIEVPPYGSLGAAEASIGSHVIRGRLSTEQSWHFPTPVFVMLSDGVVTAVSDRPFTAGP